MKAVVYERYGTFEIREIEKPAVPDGGVLVRVRAVSINPADWYFAMGRPYLIRAASGLRKPKLATPASDFAGTVEAVGHGVERLRPGDEVFGGRRGSLAEYVAAPHERMVPKPARVTFEQAASVPLAGLTALQGLRDQGRVRAGQKVLINGASGGVGTFAVQIAKALGAEVTAVCSTRNVDQARSLGADHVVDYTRGDFTRSDQRYDLLFDVAGSRSWADCRRVLARDAIAVIAGGPRSNPWIGPLGHLAGFLLASTGASQKVKLFVAKANLQDLEVLREMLEAGTLKPVVDRCYPMQEAAGAYRYLGEGHARGKIVVTVP